MADSKYRVENPEGGEQKRVAGRAGRESASFLHVPDAPHRPGDEPRFARFTQQPGDLSRPDPLAHYEQLRPHATGLVRVLNDDGQAAGPWDPKLSPAELRTALMIMVHTRQLDRRMLTMQRQGRLSFYLESTGEEAVAAGAGMALLPDDLLFPSYRQQGLFLARGMPLLDMMCQCIGNRSDNSKGRQMPVHYSWRKGNLVSISSPVGTQFPQAVGAAMATAYRGESHVVATWIGEGTTAQGDFHYALNFASVYMPPVLMHIVNNQWAISTHRNLSTGGKSFAARADAYGMPGIRVDGNDFLAVHAVTQWAADRARQGGGPTLIELLTYRAGAHSTSDDPSRYRPSDEGRLWPGGDPIARLAQHLVELGEWSDEKQQELEHKAERMIAQTYKQAEKVGSLADGPHDPPETIFDDVYQNLPEHLQRQRDELGG
ncbi:MAG: thiamine pyrophosphate-dependent dehydrogenase E1 component subunit alpha [Pirellulales bacterium]